MCKDNHKSCSGHHHHDVSQVSKSKLIFVIIFNFTIAIAEVIGGLISGSLALISDAIHNLSDTTSMILSYITVRISEKPKSKTQTYGYKRANILSAFVNSSVLIGIAVYLVVEAIHKITSSTKIEGNIVILVAVIGLLGNLFSMLLLKNDVDKNINIKSSYLHLLSDTLSSVVVVISGILIKYTSTYWIDSALTILINILILKSSYSVLKESINILMQGTPLNLDIDEIVYKLQDIKEIKVTHHFHVWRLDEKNIILEGHIQIDDMLVSETQSINSKIQELLKNQFGINHVVIQYESVNCHKSICEI